MAPIVELARRPAPQQQWLAGCLDHFPTGSEPTKIVDGDSGGAIAERSAAGWSLHPVAGSDPSGRAAAAAAHDLAAWLLAGATDDVEVHVWLDLPDEAAARLADSLDTLGRRRDRYLLQLRAALPVVPSKPLAVRRLTPADLEEVVRVNNAAFSWHPEQGHMTIEDLRARIAKDWFDPQDFLIHEHDGSVAGFCWVRFHPDSADNPSDPAVGEIHVIAVDPAHHGHGLGRALTAAGMDHALARGAGSAMLWVEGDNEPALGLYRSLGFQECQRRQAAILTRR